MFFSGFYSFALIFNNCITFITAILNEFTGHDLESLLLPNACDGNWCSFMIQQWLLLRNLLC